MDYVRKHPEIILGKIIPNRIVLTKRIEHSSKMAELLFKHQQIILAFYLNKERSTDTASVRAAQAWKSLEDLKGRDTALKILGQELNKLRDVRQDIQAIDVKVLRQFREKSGLDKESSKGFIENYIRMADDAVENMQYFVEKMKEATQTK